MFKCTLPMPAIVLAIQRSSLCNSNAHMGIQLLYLIGRHGVNLQKITRCSFQGHHCDYAFPTHGSPANTVSRMRSHCFPHAEFLLHPKMDLLRSVQDTVTSWNQQMKPWEPPWGPQQMSLYNTYFIKQHRATATGTSWDYQSRKIIREKMNSVSRHWLSPTWLGSKAGGGGMRWG